MILPFVALLGSIAFAPIVLRHHWERHYHEVSAGLGAVAAGYYLFILKRPDRLGHQLHEYLSFITLVGSLFVVAGGIRISIRGGSKPWGNTVFLFAAAVASNLIGTTGAAMLLIRPWIRMNRHRFSAFHTVFFIFIVANSGGCLTPIGNPPLFLGFIKGVPFRWISLHCWRAWLLMNASQLVLFYFMDRAAFLRAPLPPEAAPSGARTRINIGGGHNFLFFAVILGSLFIPDHPPFLREGLMAAAAIAAWLTTSGKAHEANDFSFAPIREVAWLFAGIFATMLPALDYLNGHARQFGIATPISFYWLTGWLSAILDNAPTYLAFAATAFGLQHRNLNVPSDVAAFLVQHPDHILAISLGAVFFGAMTYLGNGPNLMIKSIAESDGVPTPGFAEYVYKYSVPILLPLLALVGWLFL